MAICHLRNWVSQIMIPNQLTLMQLSLIQSKIHEIRGQKVMLDRDLAEMYEVENRVLNQSVQRNISRFPKDFMFQLTKAEFDSLISQNVISKKVGRGGIRKMPYAFTSKVSQCFRVY
jgi:hypothetical protein